MARGSAPGERRGGRRKGTKNKKTVEKDRIIQAAVAEAVEAGAISHPLPQATSSPDLGPQPKDVMLQIMRYFMGKAASEQRMGKPDNNIINEALKIAGWMAEKVAPFIHPRLSAMMIKQDDSDDNKTIMVRLKIGDRTETIINQADGRRIEYVEEETAKRKPAN